MEILGRAEGLDPEGRLRGPRGVRLLAETHYLRGRAAKRCHEGDRDHTDAVRWYEKAWEADPRHMEAAWDLGHLYYDFLRSPEYVAKAADRFRAHVAERERRGMPPLDEERMAIVAYARRLAKEGKGFEAGTTTPPREGGPGEK